MLAGAGLVVGAGPAGHPAGTGAALPTIAVRRTAFAEAVVALFVEPALPTDPAATVSAALAAGTKRRAEDTLAVPASLAAPAAAAGTPTAVRTTDLAGAVRLAGLDTLTVAVADPIRWATTTGGTAAIITADAAGAIWDTDTLSVLEAIAVRADAAEVATPVRSAFPAGAIRRAAEAAAAGGADLTGAAVAAGATKVVVAACLVVALRAGRAALVGEAAVAGAAVVATAAVHSGAIRVVAAIDRAPGGARREGQTDLARFV